MNYEILRVTQICLRVRSHQWQAKHYRLISVDAMVGCANEKGFRQTLNTPPMPMFLQEIFKFW